MVYVLHDISKWFNRRGRAIDDISSTCQSSPQPAGDDQHNITLVHNYFKLLSRHEPLYATTITIGNKYIGKLDWNGQYKAFIKLLRENRNKRQPIKCIYHFELTKNGQLHAHGIETGGYAANFQNAFGILGKHNYHKNSYTKINDIDSYCKYINKENVKQVYYNITKKDMVEIK